MTRYALFLGCLIPLRIPSIELASRKVFEKIGIETVELTGYSCCPEPVISRLADRKTWLAASARNLAMAEELGLDIMTLCNGCYETLVEVNETLKHEPEALEETNKVLRTFGKQYQGKVEVKHVVEVLYEDVGISKVKDSIVKPQKLKAAMHYGCHLYRETDGKDVWRKPNMMKELTQVAGAEIVDYGFERLCCGFPSMHADEEFSLKERLLPKLRKITDATADAVILTCPACTVQFETGQTLLRKYNYQFNLPAMNVMELLALAMGVPVSELSLNFHRSPVLQLAQKLEAM